ncbi:MAG: hypothetical protein J1F11_00035 [Oscillospiraceae bacterium]|nr:hypothetical protein [Oscillospiraceae bacterium]
MFISDYNSESHRNLIIDEDENTVWAYLTQPFSDKIFLDCWIANKINAPSHKDIKENIDQYKNAPPPAPVDVLVEGYVNISMPREDMFKILWSTDGETVSIYMNDSLTAVINAAERQVFNKFLCVDCAWGKPLNVI